MDIDTLVEIEYERQEAMWQSYERADPMLIEMGWIKEPDARRTREQIRRQFMLDAHRGQTFRMDKVLTGARRKWSRHK